jgi:hypothetical protein
MQEQVSHRDLLFQLKDHSGASIDFYFNYVVTWTLRLSLPMGVSLLTRSNQPSIGSPVIWNQCHHHKGVEFDP